MFLAFKRMFGEHLYSLKYKNMVQEVRIKMATYNKLIDIHTTNNQDVLSVSDYQNQSIMGNGMLIFHLWHARVI